MWAMSWDPWLAGRGQPGQGPFPAKSLARFWERATLSRTGEHETLLSERSVKPGELGQSIVLGRFHYIKRADGKEELYDWQADPSEEHDLTATERRPQELARLRASLEAKTKSE